MFTLMTHHSMHMWYPEHTQTLADIYTIHHYSQLISHTSISNFTLKLDIFSVRNKPWVMITHEHET
jgi:hypothetical protein